MTRTSSSFSELDTYVLSESGERDTLEAHDSVYSTMVPLMQLKQPCFQCEAGYCV